MITDALCLLSNAQALTATAVSTNAYDLGGASRNVGAGEQLAIVFSVDVAAASDTGGTFQFGVITDDAEALGSNTNLTAIAIPQASLVAGFTFALAIPPLVAERYIGAEYTLGGTNPTVTVTAFIAPMSFAGKFIANPDGFTIV